MKGKNCLVTGGSGFVGGHLVKKLVNLGANVSIIDIQKPDSSIKDNAKFFNCDIRDSEKLDDVCKNIDYVLSSELMEPNKAQSHYSEKLIKLPNLGYCYEKPVTKILKNKNASP